MLWILGSGKAGDTLKRMVTDAFERAERSLAGIRDITDLREEIETLKIEKARREEEYARREREVEHKVGLERKRQAVELANATREATLKVREENLAADKTRFAEEMKFQRERFTTEVSYLKEMLQQVLANTAPAAAKAKR